MAGKGRRTKWPAANGIDSSIRSKARPIDSIQPGREVSQAEIQRIAHGLRVVGQYAPIAVRRKTKVALTGSAMLLAARNLGWDKIAVEWI